MDSCRLKKDVVRFGFTRLICSPVGGQEGHAEERAAAGGPAPEARAPAELSPSRPPAFRPQCPDPSPSDRTGGWGVSPASQIRGKSGFTVVSEQL